MRERKKSAANHVVQLFQLTYKRFTRNVIENSNRSVWSTEMSITVNKLSQLNSRNKQKKKNYNNNKSSHMFDADVIVVTCWWQNTRYDFS